MAAEQISGGPVAAPAPAAPAAAPDGKVEAPDVSSDDGGDESEDPGERLRKASEVLRSARRKQEQEERDEEAGADVPADANKDEAAPAEKPSSEASFSVDAYRQKIAEAIKDLTPEQRDEVLGTSDEAFAAITAKRRRLHKEREEFREEIGKYRAERSMFEKERESHKALTGEWDEMLLKGKKNPHEALALFGWDLQQAFEFDSTGRVPQELVEKTLEEKFETKYEKRIRELEERLQAEEEGKASRAKTERERVNEDTWHGNVRQAVGSIDPKQLPYLAKVPDKDRVFRGVVALQTQKWNAHIKAVQEAQQRGVPPPKFEPLATPTALGYLEHELRTQHSWFSDPAQAGAAKAAAPEAGTGPRTLSATMVSEHVSGGDEDPAFESPRDRVQAALRALRGEG